MGYTKAQGRSGPLADKAGESTHRSRSGGEKEKALSSRGRGRLRGFLELRRQCGVSHEVRRGAQGASRVAPGKSGLHVHGEGERIIALELW